MEVVRHTDPRSFLTAIDRGDDDFEARNNLVFGVAGTLVERPGAFETFHLWTVDHGTSLRAAAVFTPPYRPALADATAPDAVAALAEAMHADLGRIDGALGNLPTADWFVTAWAERTGDRAEVLMREGVFRLTEVTDLTVPPGQARAATAGDEELLVRWFLDFAAEALPHETPDEDRSRGRGHPRGVAVRGGLRPSRRPRRRDACGGSATLAHGTGPGVPCREGGRAPHRAHCLSRRRRHRVQPTGEPHK
jgi:hypothetical protein